jgi:hypothetical protein
MGMMLIARSRSLHYTVKTTLCSVGFLEPCCTMCMTCMPCYPFASTAASNSSPKRPDHPGVESWIEPAVHAEWTKLQAGHLGRENLQQNGMSRPPGRQKHATCV